MARSLSYRTRACALSLRPQDSSPKPVVDLGTTGIEEGGKYFSKADPAKLQSMKARQKEEQERDERKHNELLEQWQTKRGELYDNFMESGFGADDQAAAITIEVRAARPDGLEFTGNRSLTRTRHAFRLAPLQGDAPWEVVSQAFVKAMWDNGIYG